MSVTESKLRYKQGSLFDGSGGLPLAGSLCGIEPCWAAEVEPYPIAVTRSRFPNMKHLGDISKVNGGEIEPVDIITFGSPCQDLSVAGKRAGLKHEANGDDETTRSGLFMEAVRIIKEMRAATGGQFPRFALWENVPGAFSSQKGEDFRVVLEELIRIVEPGAVMPPVPKAGWAYADHYRGDGWSLAWRVFDAQYWGVPQRRRRIHLVVDLRGECAGEVLFEREGVRGNSPQSRAPWQSLASYAQGSPGADDREGEGAGARGRGRELAAVGLTNRGLCSGDKAETLRAESHGALPMVAEAVPYTLKIRSGCEGGGKGPLVQEDKSATLATNNDQYLFQPICMATQQGGAEIRTDDKAPTITAAAGMSGNNQPVVCYPNVTDRHILDDQGDQQISVRTDGKAPTLRAEMHENIPAVLEPKIYDARGNGDGQTVNTLTGDHNNRITDYTSVVVEPAPIQYIVRRLTPTECARLQGFPDRWGDIDEKDRLTPEEFRFWHEVRNTHARINGKKVQEYTEAQMLTWYNKLHTDSAEYKMWGNGIALPPALYCMQGIVDAMGKGGGSL